MRKRRKGGGGEKAKRLLFAVMGRNANQQPVHHLPCVQEQQDGELLNEKFKELAENNSTKLMNLVLSLYLTSQPVLLSHYPLSAADREELELISSTPRESPSNTLT